jgi:hypothetical protein
MTMLERYNDLPLAQPSLERQVGQPLPEREVAQRTEQAPSSASDASEQIERVYHLMRRDPMLERGRQG